MIRIKLLSALLLLAISASPVVAEIKLGIGEPLAESTKSGIGQISGWAVSDVPIVSVEALIDGVSLGLVPYGGTRQDVASQFPDFPDSEFSGWSMKWNYALLEPGEHTLTIILTDAEGATLTRDVVFSTIAFKSAFISKPEMVKLLDADISLTEDGLILISGAEIDGETVDVLLRWDTASQQFLISEIIGEDPVPQNQAPRANAGPNQQVDLGTKAVVEGEAYDPDGTIVSYSWSQVSGIAVDLVNADKPMVEFIAPEIVGTIRLRLVVKDDAGAEDRDDTIIAVVQPDTEPENLPPTADAGPNRTMLTNESLQIQGSGSDEDGTIASWRWEQLSGIPLDLQNTDSQTVQIQAPGSAGEALLRLTVTDDDGAESFDNFSITVEEAVSEPNKPPVANAGYSFTVDTGEAVSINGSGSDSDGQIVSWQWERVSGLVVALQFPNTNRVQFVAPDNTGTIVLRLTVTDEDGATGSDEVTVTVQNPPPPPNENPTANAGSNQTVQQGDEVTLSGSGNDPDGTIVSWSWARVSGPSVSISNANSQEASFTAPDTTGDIRIRLTVTDNEGASDTDDVIIKVEGEVEPDNTTGETVFSMLAVINDARGQEQDCGGTMYPAQDPLSWSGSLADIARLHSMDMAREGYFDHDSLDGTDWSDRVFPYWSGNRIGENIAASSNNRSNSQVVQMWLDSPPHCRLIMDPDFSHAGIGAGHDSDNGFSMHHFWTLDFGG